MAWFTRWTAEQIEILRELRDKGCTAADIGTVLGFSRNAVLGKLHRIGHIWTGFRTRPLKRKESAGTPSRPRRRKHNPVASPVFPPPPQYEETPVLDRPTIITIGRHQCRYPIGHPGALGFGFCGKLTDGVYCRYHRELCHVTASRMRL